MVRALPQLLRLERGGEPLFSDLFPCSAPIRSLAGGKLLQFGEPIQPFLHKIAMAPRLIPDAVRGAGDTAGKETDNGPALLELTFGQESKLTHVIGK